MLSSQLPQCDGKFLSPQEHPIHIQQRNDVSFHNIVCSFIACKHYFNDGNQTQGNFRGETFRCHMIWNIILTPEFFSGGLWSLCLSVHFPLDDLQTWFVKLGKKLGCNNTMYNLDKIRQWTQLVATTWWSADGQSWPWVYKKGQKGECNYIN